MSIDLFEDITKAVDAYWMEKFGDGVQVFLAYPDMRVLKREAKKYPAASIVIIGLRFANERRYGGVNEVVNADVQAGTATISQPPVPIDIDFQLDTLSANRGQDWDLSSIALRVLGSTIKAKLTTGEGREIFLDTLPGSLDGTDGLSDGDLWRKAYRFRVQAWLADDTEAQQAYLVQQMIFNINDVEIAVPEEGL